MLADLQRVMDALAPISSVDEVRSAVVDENILRKPTEATRRKSLRYLAGHARSIALLEESLGLYRSLDDRPGIAHALVNLGGAVYFAGDPGRAEPLVAESVELCRGVED